MCVFVLQNSHKMLRNVSPTKTLRHNTGSIGCVTNNLRLFAISIFLLEYTFMSINYGWVAHVILVSAPVPLIWVLGLGLDNIVGRIL